MTKKKTAGNTVHCGFFTIYISNCRLQKINTFITRTVKSSFKYRFYTAQSGIHHKISSGNTTLIEHFKHTKTTVQTIKKQQRKSKDEKEKPHRIKQEKKKSAQKEKNRNTTKLEHFSRENCKTTTTTLEFRTIIIDT